MSQLQQSDDTASPTFWSKVMDLMSGSVLAQGINILMLPVLARIYVPDEFGVFGVFLAAVAVMVVIINMGYEMALMLPESEEESKGLFLLSLRACLVLSLLFLLVALMLPVHWLEEVGQGGIIGWHLLIPLSVAMEGIIQPYGVAFNRQAAYRTITNLRIARATTTAAVSLMIGLFGGGVIGLIGGFLAGQFIHAVASVWIWKRDVGAIRSSEKMISLAMQYKDFPGYGMASAWLNVASKQVIFFLLPGYFGDGPTGQFSKAERILNLPPGILSMTVGKVYFEEATQEARKGPEYLADLTRKTAFRVALLGLPVLIVIVLAGPQIFAFVLGAEWTQAGEFAQWLSPWLYLTMIASPLSYLIDVKRKLKEFLVYNFCLFTARTSILVWAGTRFTVMETVAWFGISGAMLVGIQVLYLLWLGGVFFRNSRS